MQVAEVLTILSATSDLSVLVIKLLEPAAIH